MPERYEVAAENQQGVLPGELVLMSHDLPRHASRDALRFAERDTELGCYVVQAKAGSCV